jgi:hypothetical protein
MHKENIADGTLRVSSAPLTAASFLIGDACWPVNDFFMYCKRQSRDPSSCLPLGLLVRNCVRHVFSRIERSQCMEEFSQFWRCLDHNSLMQIYCRVEETRFYECARQSGSGLSDLHKGLWRGSSHDHPAGVKDEGNFPEQGSFWYRYHVWRYKRPYTAIGKDC